MAATTAAAGADQIDPDDPYRYGWRYVRRVDERGKETWEQVPLTLDDVLHPEEDDFIVQSESHNRRCRYLAEVFNLALAPDPTTVVVQDMRIDWSIPGVRAHGPDLAVFLGVRERKDWRTFYVREEEARPALVVEVTSLSTVDHDRTTKLRHYARIGIPLYVLVDGLVAGQEGVPQLTGYQLAAGRYRTMSPDARGRLWLTPVRLWLGVEDGEIVCYDEADRPLGDYTALATELAAERAALATERAARLMAEARVRELEEELRRLRGGDT